jgi:hypothetical protein
MQSQIPPVYYIIFTAITSLGVLLQAAVLLGMFLAVRRLTTRVHALTDQLEPHIVPAAAAARSLIEDVSPKVKVAATNIVEASHLLRQQAGHVTTALDDLLNKTTAQADRVDKLVSAGIDSASHATQTVQHAFSVPVRQASAVFAGLKAGFVVLRGKNHVSPPPDDFGE